MQAPSKLPETLAISSQGQESIEAFNQAVDSLQAKEQEMDAIVHEAVESATQGDAYAVIEDARASYRQARITLASDTILLWKQRAELLADLEQEAAFESARITEGLPDLYESVRNRLTAENPNVYGHLSEPRMSVVIGRDSEMAMAKVRADACNAIILQCQRESGNGTLASAEADYQNFLKGMIE